jgi:hypothetical protein
VYRNRRRLRVDDDVRLVPGTDAAQDDHRDEGNDAEPGDAALTVGQHDERRQQRSCRRPGVPADLKERLREAVPAARGQTRDARGFRVENRRPDADECDCDEDGHVGRRARQQEQADQRESHADRQRIGPWPPVRDQPDERLEQ